MKSTQGFSLMELTIAIAIGGVMLLGLIKLYLSFQRNYRLIKMKADLQVRMRYGYHFLENAIHTAGAVDCVDENNQENKQQLAVYGFGASQVPLVWHIKPIKNSSVLVVASCKYTSNQMKFIKTAYYVSDTHRKNQWHKPIYAFYMKYFDGRRRELLENVVQMKIKYGVTAHDKPAVSSYIVADHIVNWETVRSVAIQLLLRSDAMLLKKPNAHYFYQPISIYAALRVFEK